MKIVILASWFAKCLLVAALGIPLFFGSWPITLLAPDKYSFVFFGWWIGYSILIHLVILAVAGNEKWMEWFAVSVVLTCVVALGSAALLQALNWMGVNMKGVDGKLWTHEVISRDAVQRLIFMATVIPYALFAVNSIPVARAIDLLQRRTGTRSRAAFFAPRALLVLRLYQHVIEVIPPLLLIWKEEHPRYIVPRFTTGIAKGPFGWPIYGKWFLSSVWAWAVTCIMFTFEPVPLFTAEFETYFEGDE